MAEQKRHRSNNPFPNEQIKKELVDEAIAVALTKEKLLTQIRIEKYKERIAELERVATYYQSTYRGNYDSKFKVGVEDVIAKSNRYMKALEEYLEIIEFALQTWNSKLKHKNDGSIYLPHSFDNGIDLWKQTFLLGDDIVLKETGQPGLASRVMNFAGLSEHIPKNYSWMSEFETNKRKSRSRQTNESRTRRPQNAAQNDFSTRRQTPEQNAFNTRRQTPKQNAFNTRGRRQNFFPNESSNPHNRPTPRPLLEQYQEYFDPGARPFNVYELD
jgi:hypothetical protein